MKHTGGIITLCLDRQTVEAECAGKTTLVVQAELKLEWGREKYINCFDGEERGAIASLRLGGWMAHHLRNEWHTAKMATPAGEISLVGTW